MKTLIFAALALLVLAVPARSQKMTNADPVKLVVPFQTVCSSTTVGLTATEMSGNTTNVTTTAGISSIKIVNATTGSTVCCSHSSSVTCNGTVTTDGDPIASSSSGPKNWLSWAINTAQTWYCIATTASSGVIVCKVR